MFGLFGNSAARTRKTLEKYLRDPSGKMPAAIEQYLYAESHLFAIALHRRLRLQMYALLEKQRVHADLAYANDNLVHSFVSRDQCIITIVDALGTRNIKDVMVERASGNPLSLVAVSERELVRFGEGPNVAVSDVEDKLSDADEVAEIVIEVLGLR